MLQMTITISCGVSSSFVHFINKIQVVIIVAAFTCTTFHACM